jgi:hypothetical protein
MNGTLDEGLRTLMIAYRLIILRTRNISDKHRGENQNTHFVFHKVLSKSCRL